MNCYKHPEQPAENRCSLCERTLCDECQIRIGNDTYCHDCVQNAVKTRRAEQTIKQRPGEEKSRFFAFILSFMPGVGYMYLGLMKRGFQTLITFLVSIFLSAWVDLQDVIMPIVVPVLMFYTIFDTQQLVRKLNGGEVVEDKELFSTDLIKVDNRWIGYGLIGIGVLAFARNAIPEFFSFYFRQFVGPVLIILLGIYILRRTVKQ